MAVSASALQARDVDREFFARELASFVPDRIFDAHCHLLPPEGAGGARLPEGMPDSVDLQEYRRLIDFLHPGRPVSSLFIPFPNRELRDAGNAWIARNTAPDPTCRGLFLVRPEDDPEWVRDQVRTLGLHGLKCYHTLALMDTPTWEADVAAFLPDPLVRVAHEEGWVITLHLVKSRAVADPGNVAWIRRCCTRHPGMKLILAHSARGFQPAHNLEGLPELKGLENLYFDTSANCEPLAHEAIIRVLGHRKLMYGSDFWVSHFRGRSLGAADSFVWLYEDTPVWGEKHLRIEPVLLGLEHLRSIKWACWSAGLKDSQVEDLFWNNAAELFGL
jgi:hypothetical protein